MYKTVPLKSKQFTMYYVQIGDTKMNFKNGACPPEANSTS